MVFGFGACNQKSDFPECNNTLETCFSVNLFSLEDDRTLGAQVAAEIASKPNEFPILPEAQYPQAYAFLRGMRDKLLNTGRVRNKDAFNWPVFIIRDDATLNAFVTPGGNIYVYTGLIKYLDREDDLAGVMGHEIAHADLRHGTNTLTQQYGLGVLLSVIAGNEPGLLTQIAVSLANLQYSRCNESQSDALSVDYLAGTTYNCKGTASFFAKLQEQGQGSGTPTFLSTHPDPGDRVKSIVERGDCIKCNTNPTETGAYAAFKASLP